MFKRQDETTLQIKDGQKDHLIFGNNICMPSVKTNCIDKFYTKFMPAFFQLIRLVFVGCMCTGLYHESCDSLTIGLFECDINVIHHNFYVS